MIKKNEFLKLPLFSDFLNEFMASPFANSINNTLIINIVNI